MPRIMSLLAITSVIFGCNGGDADAEPSFTLESATHELNPETAKEVGYPGIPGVMNADDDNEDGNTDWKEEFAPFCIILNVLNSNQCIIHFS